MSETITNVTVTMTVNGRQRTATCEPRKLLSDMLREDLVLTGTHVGCEHGACGACTILVDGAAVRSCLMFAAQVDGAALREASLVHWLTVFRENGAPPRDLPPVERRHQDDE